MGGGKKSKKKLSRIIWMASNYIFFDEWFDQYVGKPDIVSFFVSRSNETNFCLPKTFLQNNDQG